jgi:hypothetical protein
MLPQIKVSTESKENLLPDSGEYFEDFNIAGIISSLKNSTKLIIRKRNAGVDVAEKHIENLTSSKARSPITSTKCGKHTKQPAEILVLKRKRGIDGMKASPKKKLTSEKTNNEVFHLKQPLLKATSPVQFDKFNCKSLTLNVKEGMSSSSPSPSKNPPFENNVDYKKSGSPAFKSDNNVFRKILPVLEVSEKAMALKLSGKNRVTKFTYV